MNRESKWTPVDTGLTVDPVEDIDHEMVRVVFGEPATAAIPSSEHEAIKLLIQTRAAAAVHRAIEAAIEADHWSRLDSQILPERWTFSPVDREDVIRRLRSWADSADHRTEP